MPRNIKKQSQPQPRRSTRKTNKSPPVPSVPLPALSSEPSRSMPSPGRSVAGSPSPTPSVLDNFPSSASTRHRRSISDLDVAEMDALGQTMGDISVAISSAKLSRPAIAELEELRELQDLVDKYQKAADWVKAQDPVKFTTVKAVTLSKATIPLLESIGTEFPKRDDIIDNDVVTQEWLKSKNVLSEQDLVKLGQWDKTVLTRTLKRLDNIVNDKVEASARMTIDRWVFELSEFCEGLDIITQIFPESIISESSNAPAVITHGKVRIRLTGLTDYLLWMVSGPEFKALKEIKMGTNTFQRYQDIQNASSYVNYDKSGARLLFIEAKNVHERLESHLAQVVAQIIAASCITWKTKATSGLKIPGMPFVLTNGKQWIFGVVSSGPEKTKCMHTAELEFSEKETTLLTVLYIWATKSITELLTILDPK